MCKHDRRCDPRCRDFVRCLDAGKNRVFFSFLSLLNVQVITVDSNEVSNNLVKYLDKEIRMEMGLEFDVIVSASMSGW